MNLERKKIDIQISPDNLFTLIKSFASTELPESEWHNIKELIMKIEKKNKREEFYTYKKLAYFCTRIDKILADKPELKIQYSELLQERQKIGLKLQVILQPILIHRLDIFTKTTGNDSIMLKEILKWERSNNLPGELSYFIRKNFNKYRVESSFFAGIMQEIQDKIDLNKLLEENHPRNKMFKLSADGKYVHLLKGKPNDRWNIINDNFYETDLNYEDVHIAIESEESLYKSDNLRFDNLYRVLYPKTVSCTVIASINQLVAELTDLKNLLGKKIRLREKYRLANQSGDEYDIDLDDEGKISNPRGQKLCDFSNLDEALGIEEFTF